MGGVICAGMCEAFSPRSSWGQFPAPIPRKPPLEAISTIRIYLTSPAQRLGTVFKIFFCDVQSGNWKMYIG